MTKKKAKPKIEQNASPPLPVDQAPPVAPPAIPPGVYPIPIAAPKHKVAILGTTPHRTQAPFADKSWEIWGVGPAMHDMIGTSHRFDRWLEVHNPDIWVTGETANEHTKNTYLPWLRSIGPKAMILKPHAVLPQATVIDIERLIRVFGGESIGLIKGSIEWCIAIALLTYHIDQPGQLAAVGAWGVDYATSEERRAQKDGMRHWMDKCRTFGVSFHLPGGSDMNAMPKPYPFNEESPLYRKGQYRQNELRSRMAERQSTADRLARDLRAVQDELQQLSGALQDCQYWQQNDWM